ncbi:MAG: 1-acyl-sn-glycerol-3-phosphate acyltransferase [Sandaracinaceae bacterium]|nr:1-acyl-sn-glycerol-3-phosphate acyltransferase [Sandaracinaceae bacterium]
MTPRAAFNFCWTMGLTGTLSVWGLARQAARPDPQAFARLERTWARWVAAGDGIVVETVGGAHLDLGRPYVLMANHQSHVDIVALFNALPMVPGFLAKAELGRIPVFGRAMAAGGHVFVERGEHARAVAAIDDAARRIREGATIVIFPEGTRSRRREVMPFKKGGFHLAMLAGVPIVPVGLRGTADILPKHDLALVPGRCEVHVGAPIDPTGRSLDELVAMTHAAICELSALPAAPDRSGA